MPEIDELKRKRMQELMQQQVQQQFQQQLQEQEIERQIKFIINQIMSPEARARLGNIKTARPQFARQIEVLLIQLYQSGRLPKQLSDGDFKKILAQITAQKRETKITRR